MHATARTLADGVLLLQPVCGCAAAGAVLMACTASLLVLELHVELQQVWCCCVWHCSAYGGLTQA